MAETWKLSEVDEARLNEFVTAAVAKLAYDTSGKLTDVEVIRVGKWNAATGPVNVTSSMLDQIVSNFSSINQVAGYGVPVKRGHSVDAGSPAYGWMSGIRRVGDVLVADFADMDPAIVDAISKRRYNSVSVEMYPHVVYEGKTFSNVLGGVALLGAEWPAVKGLKPLSASMFAGADEKLELTKEPNVANEEVKFSQAQADAFVLAAETKLTEKHTLAVKEANDKFTAEKVRADKAESDLKKFQDGSTQKDIDAVITAAEKSGKIVPANKAKVANFASSIMNAKPEDRAELLTTFGELVNGMKPVVKFGEDGSAHVDDSTVAGQKTADIIDERAKKLMSAAAPGKMSYSDAVTSVLNSDDALRHAYAAE